MSNVTRILDRVQQDDPKAADELLPLVYEGEARGAFIFLGFAEVLCLYFK